MDLLKEVSDIFGDVKNFKECKNYYFEKHNCGENGDNKKILLDFTVANEMTDKIVRFGYCRECKTLFFHRDFVSKRL